MPTVTIGGRLASLQAGFQKKLQQLASKASTVLSELNKVAVPTAQHVSNRAAKVAADLSTLSADATNLSTTGGDVSARLAQNAAEASAIASMAADVRTRLEALPASVRGSPAVTVLHAKVVALEDLALAHAAGLATTAGSAKTLHALAVSVSASLAANSASANALSAKAAQAAPTLANATISAPKHRGTIQPRQVGGGASLDAAVGQLDAAISQAGTKVDNDYAYLSALDTRASQSLLPAGNATGATAQAGAVVYPIAGADPSQKHIHYATVIGVTALILGATIGLGLYRIRRGEASSLVPAKT